MPQYYEFEVTLQEITPPIWRRFQITATATFADLHDAIQNSMGWLDCHMWEFAQDLESRTILAGLPDKEYGDDDTPDASKVELSTYFGAKPNPNRCSYTYDFGDNWQHEVVLTQLVESEERFERRLLDGKLACPLDDSGGIFGYGRLVEFLKTGRDPDGEDEVDLKNWIGEWEPEYFDLGKSREEFDR